MCRHSVTVNADNSFLPSRIMISFFFKDFPRSRFSLSKSEDLERNTSRVVLGRQSLWFL